MARTINVEITGQFVRKDSKNAGVQGEGNVTTLHITMDESWSGYGKRIVWRDANGENPVSVVLFEPVDVDTNDGLSYDTMIPSEPLALPGWCSFTVEGYMEQDGVHSVSLSISDHLFVEESDSYYKPAEPTPSEMQQIMETIAKNEEIVTAAATEAKSWAVGGTGSREGEDTDNAKYYAESIADDAAAATENAESAAESANTATAKAGEAASSAASAASASTESKSWAVGGTGSRAGEDTDNAKYYAQIAEQIAGGGVMTFNGRGGNVMPQEGDYTAEMVGADPEGSAEAVAESLLTHTSNMENPHQVEADQVPYDNSRVELSSDNVQGAIDELFARMYGDLKVQVQVYETGTTTPISGVIVTGIASETGGVCYANSNGIATGYVLSDEQSATVTVKVGTDYIDLTGQTSKQVTVTKGVTAHATIYATRVSNPSGKIETYTTSTQRMFTDKVKRVDVHAVGAGAGGSTGYKFADSEGNTWGAYSGKGGAGGASVYKNSVSFTPNSLFSITVGAAGTGATSTDPTRSVSGTSGGSSFALGVTASGGAANGGGTAAYGYYHGLVEQTDPGDGNSNTVKLFGDSSASIAGGGDGGGGRLYVRSAGSSSKFGAGGAPHGGNGGDTSSSDAFGGAAATGVGGGGGGGGFSQSAQYERGIGDGGNGYRGQVWIRWWY